MYGCTYLCFDVPYYCNVLPEVANLLHIVNCGDDSNGTSCKHLLRKLSCPYSEVDITKITKT